MKTKAILIFLLITFLLTITPVLANGDTPTPNSTPEPVDPSSLGDVTNVDEATVKAIEEAQNEAVENATQTGGTKETIFQTLVKNIIQVSLPYGSLSESILMTFHSTLNNLSGGAIEYKKTGTKDSLYTLASPIMEDVLEKYLFEADENPNNNSEDNWINQNFQFVNSSLDDIRLKGWSATFAVAMTLMPLTLLWNIMVAFRDAATSPSARANLWGQIADWLIQLCAILVSYYLISALIDLSNLMGSGVAKQLVGIEEIGNLANSLFNMMGFQIKGGIISLVTGQIGNVAVAIALNILLLIGFLCVIGSVVIVSFAKMVAFTILIAGAPLILMIGTVSQFRWLTGLYTKVLTIAFLLPVINALLIGLMVAVGSFAVSSTTNFASRVIVGAIFGIGLGGTLIGVNSMMIKGVYGAAINVADKAVRSGVNAAKKIGFAAAAVATGGTSSIASGALAGKAAIGNAANNNLQLSSSLAKRQMGDAFEIAKKAFPSLGVTSNFNKLETQRQATGVLESSSKKHANTRAQLASKNYPSFDQVSRNKIYSNAESKFTQVQNAKNGYKNNEQRSTLETAKANNHKQYERMTKARYGVEPFSPDHVKQTALKYQDQLRNPNDSAYSIGMSALEKDYRDFTANNSQLGDELMGADQARHFREESGALDIDDHLMYLTNDILVESGVGDTFTDDEIKEVFASTRSISSDFPGINIERDRDQIINTYKDNDVLHYSRKINNGDSHDFNL